MLFAVYPAHGIMYWVEHTLSGALHESRPGPQVESGSTPNLAGRVGSGRARSFLYSHGSVRDTLTQPDPTRPDPTSPAKFDPTREPP